MDDSAAARDRFTALASRQDYRMARLQLDLEHFSMHGRTGSRHPRHLLSGLLALRRAERLRIDELLRRMDSGRYGRCEKCTGEVGADRLRRLPHALYCAGCVYGDDPDFRSHIAHQQASLEQLLGAVRGLCDDLLERGHGEDVSLAGSDAVAELLSDLSEELREHFALEETDGYLAELTRVAPDLSKQVETVQWQHVDLFQLSARLVGLARDAGTSAEQWQKIDADLRDFADRLRSHEREEMEMTESTLTPG